MAAKSRSYPLFTSVMPAGGDGDLSNENKIPKNFTLFPENHNIGGGEWV